MKIPDIAEQRAIKLFTKEYGYDIVTRYKKFQEELKELDEVFQECFVTGIMTPDLHKHLLDELSDVQGTFTHLASLMGLYQREMLHNCIDKIITRKTNPDYKRFRLGEDKDSLVLIPVPEYDEEIMGLKISFIEQEIKRESLQNNNQMYLAGRHIPDNWNEIKAAYFDFINNKKE